VVAGRGITASIGYTDAVDPVTPVVVGVVAGHRDARGIVGDVDLQAVTRAERRTSGLR
jgi:hypothetical protein